MTRRMLRRAGRFWFVPAWDVLSAGWVCRLTSQYGDVGAPFRGRLHNADQELPSSSAERPSDGLDVQEAMGLFVWNWAE